MSRVHAVDHKGKRVILLDFSGVTRPEEWAEGAAEAARLFGAMPPDRSALTLTDVSGTRYNREAIETMKALSRANTPYVKAGAVVSASVMHRAAIGMVALFAKRKFEVFETRQAALDWLVSQ